MDFMQLAFEKAAKSTAKKRKVGCVIVAKTINGNNFVAHGFNLNKEGVELSCEDENGKTLPEVLHAEEVAINNFEFAVHDNLPPHIDFSIAPTVFITHQPCENCIVKLSQFFKDYFTVDVNLRDHNVIADTGMKFDTAKLRLDLVPPGPIEALAAVLTYGAKKYKPNNWRSVEAERYVAAFERHWLAYRQGGILDPESKLPHLAHCMTNLAFLLELNYKPERQLTLADYCKNSEENI
jgi:tRNA(Arg) A34 adenosine deaminase TadA